MGFGLILIVLGIIGAHQLVGQKIPAAKQYVDMLCNYREIIGAAGMVSGLIWAFEWLVGLRYFYAHSLAGILALAGTLLTLALGVIFGFDFVMKDQKGPPSAFFVRVSAWRVQLLPYEQKLSQAAIVVGGLYFLVSLF